MVHGSVPSPSARLTSAELSTPDNSFHFNRLEVKQVLELHKTQVKSEALEARGHRHPKGGTVPAPFTLEGIFIVAPPVLKSSAMILNETIQGDTNA